MLSNQNKVAIVQRAVDRMRKHIADGVTNTPTCILLLTAMCVPAILSRRQDLLNEYEVFVCDNYYTTEWQNYVHHTSGYNFGDFYLTMFTQTPTHKQYARLAALIAFRDHLKGLDDV